MNVPLFARHALPALVMVAALGIGVGSAAAEDVAKPTFHDVIETEVIESYPELSAAQPEAVDPVASGGALAGQPPTGWDHVVGSTCVDPEPLCDVLP